ncbi:MAG: SIMPL domain-containing protein [Oscillatoriales cyanobacterium SM2_2_1]|nr:SIMPL domain-containing protein [Oscillatoriales cyanobacterium SM2_2_1]
MERAIEVKGFPQVFAGMVAISVSLVVGAAIAGTSLRALRSNDQLTVIGSSTRPIKSDYAIWRASVTSQQTTLPQAYRELQQRTERVRRYLREKKIPDDAVTLAAITTEPFQETTSSGGTTGRILFYRLSQRFEVRSENIELIATIAQASTELINESVPFVSEPPEYLYTKLEDLRVEMIEAATRDAKARAEAIARVSNSRVGAVRAAETDAFQVTARFSTEASDRGSYSTATIEKDIRAVVAITFAVE